MEGDDPLRLADLGLPAFGERFGRDGRYVLAREGEGPLPAGDDEYRSACLGARVHFEFRDGILTVVAAGCRRKGCGDEQRLPE